MPNNCYDSQNHKTTPYVNYLDKIKGQTITCNKTYTTYPSYSIKNIVRKTITCG
jgi:hypothetical protein